MIKRPDPSSTSWEAAEVDGPICPKCGYSLVGLQSRRCPECGTGLDADLSRYRPSQFRTPWVRGSQPWRLFQGVVMALRHPRMCQERCNEPVRVAQADAWIFAWSVMVLWIIVWPWVWQMSPHRMLMLLYISMPRNRWVPDAGWAREWIWISWAMLRWWVLLTPLGMVRGRKDQMGLPLGLGERAKRLALFAPWMVLLEMGMLLAVWMVEPETLPEPATLFCVGAPWYAVSGLIRVVWLTRMVVAVPVFAVFLWAVLGIRHRLGVAVGAVVLSVGAGVALVGVDAHLHGALPVIARTGLPSLV